ncbi:hypothetical protein ACIOFQ_32895 [[Kitasatospora] papulosa]|uniref:hypothetical protein n=1 Tax=[Kitasatospora] papulosa TaxID=1464011 RepID=UPI0038189441
MSVGFRPTPEDTEIIRAHQRPDESTSDVLRRALRALDRERWDQEARADMERIAADGEDLADEPDDWGHDETGKVVDLRSAGSEPRSGGGMNYGVGELKFIGGIPSAALGRDVKREWNDIPSLFQGNIPSISPTTYSTGRGRVSAAQILQHYMWVDLPAFRSCIREVKTDATSALREFDRLVPLGAMQGADTARRDSGDRHPSSWRLAHLRAARRRAGKR